VEIFNNPDGWQWLTDTHNTLGVNRLNSLKNELEAGVERLETGNPREFRIDQNLST
jgi:hypothetical protein